MFKAKTPDWKINKQYIQKGNLFLLL